MTKPWINQNMAGKNKTINDDDRITKENLNRVMSQGKNDDKKLVPVCWTTGVKRVDKCGMFEKRKFTAFITHQVHDKIRAVTIAVGKKEWLGYLKGKYFEEDDIFIIDDIVVPLQEVTAGSVDVLQPQASEEIMGTVHLHPFGGNLWFSGTDDKYIAGNHKLTIVTNPTGEYKAQMKHSLPCGGSFLVEGEVVVTTPKNDAIDAFVKESLDLILPKPPVVVDVKKDTEAVDNLPNLYCATCRTKTEPKERRWIAGVMVCEECYWEEISLGNQPYNVP